MSFYMGMDVGGTKTDIVIADETGKVVGFGRAGAGNYESVGYDGLFLALQEGIANALADTNGLTLGDIAGGGFGIAGYDWPSERPPTVEVLEKIGIQFPYNVVNDTIPGLVAGAKDGWGVVVISGTGCNCRGWDKQHENEAYMTGSGYLMAENAGSTELVVRAMQLVGFEWSHRGPATALTPALIDYAGATDIEDLIEGHCQGRYSEKINASAARMIFDVAYKGDPVAHDLIAWAGRELAAMVNGVIRKLDFESLDFDVVLSGSMFDGGELLTDPMREAIRAVAPRARMVRLDVPSVIGAVLIGMEQGGIQTSPEIRATLRETIASAA